MLVLQLATYCSWCDVLPLILWPYCIPLVL